MSMKRIVLGLSVITIALTIVTFYSAEYDFRKVFYNRMVEEFAGGDFFVSLADIVIYLQAAKSKKCIQLPIVKPHSKDTAIVYFVKTDCLGFFQSRLKNNTSKFIMITHDSDYPVSAKHRSILGSFDVWTSNVPCYYFRWYGLNIADGHPKLTGIPVGIANRHLSHGNKAQLSKPFNRRRIDLHINFSIRTNRVVRGKWYEFFCKNATMFANYRVICQPQKKRLTYNQYLEDVGNTRFVVSPPGHGIDCSRTWEALAMGAIPIVVNTSISELYEGERVLVVQDFRNVTKQMLLDFAAKNPAALRSKKVYGDYWRQRIEQDKILAKAS